MPSRIICYAICLVLIFNLSTSALASPEPKGKNPPSQGVPRSLELNEKGVHALKSKNLKLAEDLFRQAFAADPKNLTAAFNLAGTYISQKKEALAIQLLTDLTQQYGEDAGLFARLGDAYFSEKEISKAAVNYEKALAIEPTYPNLSLRLATIYTLQNRLKEAEKKFLEANKQDPNNWEILNSLSSVLLANNDGAGAIRTAKRSLQLKATTDAYVNLGNAYEIMKDKPNALIAFEKAQALGDNRAELKEKIETLKSSS